MPLLYVTHLHLKGLAPTSISVHLAAVRALHVVEGFKEPEIRTPQVNLALKGMLDAHVTTQRKPIDFNMLTEICDVVSNHSNSSMWLAVLCLAFFAGLRSSEYCDSGDPEFQGPSVGHVQFAKDKVMYFTVKRSKTKAQGFTVPLGCTKEQICPVCSMIQYLASRKHDGSLRRNAPLFLYRGSALRAGQVNQFIKKVVQVLGLDPKDYSTHSIRSGAATTAATVGFKDWELQKLGGWKSQVYKQYIREVDDHITGFTTRLTSQTRK